MKNFFLFATLCFYSSHAIAQFEWTALESHNAKGMEIIYASDDNELIGKIENPPQLMISDDLGLSWTEMYQGELAVPSYNLLPIIRKQNNTFYLAKENKLYRYDESASSFTEILALEKDHDHIEDFAFLPNGNMVLAQDDQIDLYDPTFNLLHSNHFSFYNAKFLIGEDDEHYVVLSGSNYRLYRFSSDISTMILHANIEAGISFNDIEYKNGIFNSYSSYSLDGITWEDYRFENSSVRGPFHLNQSGILFVVDRDELYSSTDRGQNFIKRADLPNDFWGADFIYSVNKLDEIADTLRHEIIIADYSACERFPVISSKNGVDNWEDVKFPEGNPYAENLEVASASNILVKSCGIYDRVKRFGDDAWNDFLNEEIDFLCDDIRQLFSFPDGTIVSNKLCFSKNEGKDWRQNEDEFISYDAQLFYKNGALYLADYNEIYKTIDQGESWEKIEMVNGSIYWDYPSAISSSEHIFLGDFFGEGIQKIDFSGNVVSNTNLDFHIILDIETSFLGSLVFVFAEEWGGDYKLFVSYDDGENYDLMDIELPINDIDYSHQYLETDRFGNLFINGGDFLYLSQDEGVTWHDITPDFPDLVWINNLDIGHDGFLYLATEGTPILKSKLPLNEPNFLKVILYEDEDGSCSYSQNENLLPGLKVNIDETYSRLTDQNGEVNIFLLEGDYQVNANLRPDLYASCDNDHAINFDGGGETQTVYIPVEILDDCADLTLGASVPFLRRCFENTLFLEIENNGTVPSENTQLKITLDEFFIFISSDMELVSNTGNTYIFNIEDVPTNEKVKGKIIFEVSCEAELGAAHYLNAELIYDNPCELTQGVSRTFTCQENIGSYDPNDMIGYINGVANKEIFATGDTLEYLIRFQNTGTDTAFNIRIEDYIGYEFDQSTLEPISASHDYTWSLDRNKLIVNFNDVLLVDSLTNEEDSHGFVQFRIGLKELMIEPGDVIDNTAEIYFDFNEPIITNTVDIFYLCKDVESMVEITICEGEEYDGYTTTGMYSDLFTTELMCDSIRHLHLIVLEDDDPACMVSDITEQDHISINIYPVPSSDLLHVDNNGATIQNYEVLNQLGQSIMQFSKLDNQQIDISHLTNGIYFLRCTTKKGNIDVKKFLKVE